MAITATKTMTIAPGEYAIRAAGTTGSATVKIDFDGQDGADIPVPTDIEIWSLPSAILNFTLSGDYTVAFLRHYE